MYKKKNYKFGGLDHLEATRGCLRKLEAVFENVFYYTVLGIKRCEIKNWVEYWKTQKSLDVLKNIISKKLRTNQKTILRTDEFENPKCRSGIF